MARKKAIRKHHDPIKRAGNQALAAAGKYLISWCMGEKEPTFFNLKGKRVMPPEDHVKIQAMTCALPWSSMCLVMCRDQLGNNYLQSLDISSKEPYTYTQLAATLNEQHQRLLDNANPMHVIGVGWISSANGKTVEDETAYSIMEELGGWELKAKWQTNP